MNNHLLSHSLKSSGMLVEMFCADLSSKELLHRPCVGANCAAWIVGHLIDSDYRVAKMINSSNLPELPAGFGARFSRDARAASANEFGDTTILIPLFRECRGVFVSAAAALTDETLEAKLEKPNARFSTIGEMVTFMAVHTAMHAGQISTIRRSLGRPPLV
jgi:uncharacterized damage-inducible protein DinB